MKVFNVIWKLDGVLTENYYVAKNKKEALNNISVYADIIKCTDVTSDFPVSIGNIISILKEHNYGEIEMNLVYCALFESSKKYDFVD